MFGVEVNEIVLLLLSPFIFVDSPFEVVVVALTALLAIAALNAVLFLHNPGNLAPSLYFPYFIDLLQNFVLLSLIQALPRPSRFFFRTFEFVKFSLLQTNNYKPLKPRDISTTESPNLSEVLDMLQINLTFIIRSPNLPLFSHIFL